MLTAVLAKSAVLVAASLMSGTGAHVTVVAGDTLSGIASQQGVSLSALEGANPQISNPDLIYAGETVNLPDGVTPVSTPAPSAPAPVQSAPAPSSSQPVTTAPTGISIPGMPQGLADCIWMRESTDGTNPAANGNQFGIIPASGYNVSGDSLAQQEQVAGQVYAQSGGAAWAADGCPGT